MSPLLGGAAPAQRRHDDDWAIVVGLDAYPALGALQGAEADAREFLAWVTDPAGGGVPAARCRLIVSSQFAPPAPDALNAKPIPGDLVLAFDELHTMFTDHGRIGRRLYIYLAGHGFAASLHQASLLTANATRTATGHHLAGALFADWFVEAAPFDEVFLFMDCCREINRLGPVIPPPYDPAPAAQAARWSYALSTEYGKVARERPMPPTNGVRGVFTTAVLSGLRGGVRPNADGEITSGALETYVQEFVRGVFNSAPNTQVVPPFGGAANLVVLEQVPAVGVEVAIRRLDGGDPQDIRVVVDGQPQPPSRIDGVDGIWILATGLYKATLPNSTQTLFEVRAEGGDQRVQQTV
jgi:hypothetical protein